MGLNNIQNEFEAIFLAIGNQGFPLSAVIDEPNMRCNGFTSVETSVHLICQKNQGMQLPVSQYLIINCQIKISYNISIFRNSVSASIPDLFPLLSTYCTQVGIKIYNVQINSAFIPSIPSKNGLFWD